MSNFLGKAVEAAARAIGESAAATVLCLHNRRDASNDQVTISEPAIAAHRGLCERTIRRHLERAYEVGLLVKHEPQHDPATGYRTASRYTVLLVARSRERLLDVVAALAGRMGRISARAVRRAELLKQYRSPTGQFAPRSISPAKIEEWLQPIGCSDRLLNTLLVQGVGRRW